jgi:hypothetical protein
MNGDFDPAQYRWTWLVLVVFFLGALLAAMWVFGEAAQVKHHHHHHLAAPPAVVSTNQNSAVRPP